jgi:alanine-glyoxylate transaminase/serine-glyoxylate transaminase/serine-pyruvate transaminase
VPSELNPPRRILLGPGPSDVHPRVLRALATPLVGHLDPSFVALMEEVKELLRATFRTRNRLTFPLSATGSAGMEAVLVNLLEPDDLAVICVNGVFGGRMAEIARRCGAEVATVEVPWGEVIDVGVLRRMLDALPQGRSPRLVAAVQAETSTGARQPLEDMSRLAQERGALFVVDAVTSLAGTAVEVDAWGIDACYSATQKCLSCPPGLAPVTLGAAALEALQRRRRKVQSWYLDLSLIGQYWGAERVYHHTAPITMVYALREALRVVLEEGLEPRFARHRRNHEALAAGLEAIGLRLTAQEGHRLWMLNSVSVPGGVDDAAVRRRLLAEHGIEIGGGLGPLRGRTWRIGLMGESSRRTHVLTLLSALSDVLDSEGFPVEPGAAVGAAERVYRGEVTRPSIER